MRSMKTLAAAAMLAATAFTTADAQISRPFHDSWFWGVNGGLVTYADGDINNPTAPGVAQYAPTIGLDWLITRTTGGLYVSFSNAFVTSQGIILNGPTSADTGFRAVDVKNIRRFNMLGMVFPGNFIRFHPYAGAGISFAYIGDAVAAGTFTQQKQIDYAASVVNDTKASFGPAFMGGMQYRLKYVSVFGQAAITAMGKDFLLSNGHTLNFGMEFGVRYNMGTSIER
jgi:hypothetical protein